MVTVSETAAKKLSSLIEETEFKTPFVRVAVKGGGCSGLSYDLSFDTDQQPKTHQVNYLLKQTEALRSN